MIAVVDYGMGNVGSVLSMLRKIGADAQLTDNKNFIESADRLIIPGVGAFDAGVSNLEQRGLRDILESRRSAGVPILGICLGMQLMTRRSQEGSSSGLGWFDAETVRFRPEIGRLGLRIPHMGWNTIASRRPHPVMSQLREDSRYYFVHSYHVACRDSEEEIATTEYGYSFASVVAKDCIIGTQFHPEKSHRFGLDLLAKFVAWNR